MRSLLLKYALIAAGCMLLSPAVSGEGERALFAQGRSNPNLAVREAEAGNAAHSKTNSANAANANQAGSDQSKGPQSKGQTKSKQDPAARDAAPNAALVDKTFRVGITLGDGRRLKGKIRVRVPERLSVVHVVDGIQYRKLVRPEQIQAIEFKRWRGRLVRQQEKGQIFQFDVDRYTIELNGGQVLKRDGELFVFLNQFVLENENGSVQLFSFWGDLQKKDGSWFTGMQGPSTSRVAAHKDVVQRIEFDES